MDPNEQKGAITPEVAKEVLRLSELYVDGTLRLSLAADGRALQISNMLAAASTLLVGYGLSNILGATSKDVQKISMGLAALSCGGIFATALIFSVRSVRPRSFNIGGNLRSSWSEEELRGSLVDAQLSQALLYEQQALRNNVMLQKNAEFITNSLRLTSVAVPIAATIGLVTFAVVRHFT